MKRNTHFITFTALIVAFLFVAAATPRSHSAEKMGTITIKNETTKTLYIVIDDFNKGEIDPNYSEEYKVPVGEHKVQAYYDDKMISKYIKVSITYPDETWCISQSEL
ncbi:MAG: hypothetical protein AB9903_13770 [Vulcanimicrobiota bacterium]